ncbi:gas vesicle protein [Streptomyces sp. NPDC002018]|uniref:gas vesicle protein n=1 Tax=Streptomyces sp. NPDC002018 TaxID=3364629 RepID=UPI0036A445A8
MHPPTHSADLRSWSEGDGYDTRPLAGRQIALIDLLDRLLTGGVVLTGELTLSIADVDLVRISLRALIVSVRAEHTRQARLEAEQRTPETPETRADRVDRPEPPARGYGPVTGSTT